MDYHDSIEEAEEVKPAMDNTNDNNKEDEKLLDIECDTKDILKLDGLDTSPSSSKNGIVQLDSNTEHKENLHELFDNLILDNNVSCKNEQSANNTREENHSKLQKSLEKQNLGLDIFDKSDTNFNLSTLSSLELHDQGEQSLQSLTSENLALLKDILGDKPNIGNEWDAIATDTFLPPNILKQSLGDAAMGIGQKTMPTNNSDDKVSKD